MKLWLLRPREDLPKHDNPWEPWFDKCFGLVVRAETEEQAREISFINMHGTERDKAEPWNDPHYSTCIELTTEGEPGIIIMDEHWA